MLDAILDNVGIIIICGVVLLGGMVGCAIINSRYARKRVPVTLVCAECHMPISKTTKFVAVRGTGEHAKLGKLWYHYPCWR